jgi:hypothetical protein
MVNRIEALADAITEYSGYRNPESVLYQARNPGALKAHAVTVLRDLDNYRVYPCFKAGWDSLLADLKAKCSGRSHTSLTQQSTLKDLLAVNGFQPTVCGYVVKFIRRALQDQTITDQTPLEFFVTE